MSEAESIDPSAIPLDYAAKRELAQGVDQKAQDAFARGELLTASMHASDLLMLFPNERAYLDRFDEIVLSTDDPLSLLPVASGSVHVATAAGRARVLMMQQRLPEALELLAAVVAVAPELPYIYWAQRWLQPQVVASLPFAKLFQSILRTALVIGVDVPTPPHEDDRRVLNLRAAAEIFSVVRAAYPNEAIVWFGEALLRRRLGDPAATLEVAEEAVSRFGQDPRLRTALMNAYRDAGRPEDALGQARTAMSLDPESFAPLHDSAWGFVDAGRMKEAAGLFDELVDRKPDYPGARGCLYYTRFKAFGSDDDRHALMRLREVEWYDDQVRRFADEVAPPQAYIDFLPGPADATGAAARDLIRELGRIIECCGVSGSVDLKVRSKHLESASVGVAFETAMRSFGASGSLTVEVEEVQTPDPRVDKAQSSTPIWKYDGTQPEKAYPAGDEKAQAAIASIARELFDKSIWDPAAKAVADSFGADGYHALVSVLTHPPVPSTEDEFDGFTWTWRCQVATAVVLSHLGDWGTGYGRAALYSMAYGPSDWTTSAAIIAFLWRSLDDASVRAEVEPIFSWMRSQIPEQGFTPWEIVLADAWLALPGHADETKANLEAWVEDYYTSLPTKNVVGPPERRYGGLSLEEYARFSAARDRILGPMAQAGFEKILKMVTVALAPEIVELCEEFNVELRGDEHGGVAPYIVEWQEALNASPELMDRFLEIQRSTALEHVGVTAEEKKALDNILDGKMDMHQRMAQAQQAQREIGEGGGGEPDPEVFPGRPVARLSDYVRILKVMQTGDMTGALAQFGLDMSSYGTVAQAWAAKMAADPVLTEKFNQMMQG